MTTELDALPETEAIRMLSMFIDTAVGTRVTMHTTRIKEVRAELIRLAEENARLRPMLTARSQEMLRLVSESGELKTRAEKAEARVQELETLNRELDFKLHDQELLAKANAEHASQRGQRVRELERENEILTIKNRGTLANNLCPDHRDKQIGKPCLACTIETLTREKNRAESELATLRAFAQEIMQAWPEGDVDGGELQEAALRHGLLERAEPTQEERDEWGLCEGDDWYRRTALVLPLDDEAKS